MSSTLTPAAVSAVEDRVPLRLLCFEADAEVTEETQPECRAALPDRVLLGDDRVLRKMLDSEDSDVRSDCYLRYSKGDLKPHMRRVVVEWMLEVTTEQKCGESVFPLSVAYLDQVVLVLPLTRKDQLQLVAAVCMFIASKFIDASPLNALHLVAFTDCSITIDQLLSWEMLVVDALKWNLTYLTPHDFIDQLLTRLPLDSVNRVAIRRHTLAFIALCTSDMTFAACPSSMVACGSILTAANGLLGPQVCSQLRLLGRLHRITSIDTECLRQCNEQIERVLQATVAKRDITSTPDPDAADRGVEDGGRDNEGAAAACGVQPNTPIDVRDIKLIDGE